MRKRTNNRNRSAHHSNGRKKGSERVSTINPDDLIRKASVIEEEEYIPPYKYNEIQLDGRLKSALAQKGFVYPTQIQAESIQPLLEGRDIVGIANTGTGKTGAFLIPVIHRLLTEKKSFQTLIVLPTRELALQVDHEFRSLTRGMGLYASTFIGGTNVGRDVQKLKRYNHVIIGTPGRLIDMMDQRALNLTNFSVLVLDEFDRMLDMGFIRDIQFIIDSMKKRRQTMLFSATMDKKQNGLINDMLTDPLRVSVSSGTASSDRINQDIIKVPAGKEKFEMLTELISGKDFNKVLLFAETKRMADRISFKLNRSGFASDMIHGNKSQNYRVTALNKFKTGKIQVLVATDVAARGIDVSDVTHVINFQLPRTIDSYIHRVGRTGRAGKTGQAYTFID